MKNKLKNLSSTHPLLCKEWDYVKNLPLTPELISHGSGKKVWWICKIGHEWLASPNNRSRDKKGGHRTDCPYCSGEKLSLENSLLKKYPNLCKEWDYKKNISMDPSTTTCNCNKKAWWICPSGHSWTAVVAKRTARGDRCPQCPKKIKAEYSFAERSPDLLEEWDFDKNKNLLPTEICPTSKKKVWWKCKYGHSWKTSLNKRSRGRNCPYCAGVYSSQEKSLFELRKDLMPIWNYNKNIIRPIDVSVSSGKKVWWICNKGHEWEAVVANISKGIGCPYCSGRNATSTDNIAIKRPDLMEEWDYEKNISIDPYSLLSSSGKKIWWKCTNGHEWIASIFSRNYGSNCPHCGKYQTPDGEICGSSIEAFYYLKLKEANVVFEHDKKYPGHSRKIRFDFYIPDQNKYMEVTTFSPQYRYWNAYIKNIESKREYVEKELKSNFEFISRFLSPDEWEYVKSKTTKTVKAVRR